jgi:hypothetical protein
MSNFHAVYMNLGVLLIECRACNHRVALEHEDGVPIWQGNMQEIRSVKCSWPTIPSARCGR